MFNALLKSFSNKAHSPGEGEAIRQQLQSIFFKIKTYQKYLKSDTKLNFKVTDTTVTDNLSETSGQITYFLGAYAIRYELDDIKGLSGEAFVAKLKSDFPSFPEVIPCAKFILRC